MRFVDLLPILSTIVVGACGKDPAPATPDIDADTSVSDAPALTGTKYSLKYGPVMVPAADQPGREGTKCIDVRLSNDHEIKVHQIHNVLTKGSHHLIVYKNDTVDAVEQPVPYECQPFTGALNRSGMVAPIMITQKADDPLTLPDTVGYTLAAHQLVRLEMHYFNTDDVAREIGADIDFYEPDPGTISQEANILFIGSPDIHIPNGQAQTIEQVFTPSRANLDLTGTKFFAITGHTHRLGKDMTVAAGPKGMTSSVYAPQPFEWAEPLTQSFRPGFEVPQGGGFKFKCDYNINTTGDMVKFGESATDEMCFFWAYYYPSKGAHVCLHSDDYGGIDICCPDNPDLCNMLPI